MSNPKIVTQLSQKEVELALNFLESGDITLEESIQLAILTNENPIPTRINEFSLKLN